MRPVAVALLAVSALSLAVDASASLRGLQAANATHTITDADGEWQLVHDTTVQPSATVSPSTTSINTKVSEVVTAPSPAATQATHHKTPLTGPIAVGAIGIVAVGLAAAVAHKKRSKAPHP